MPRKADTKKESKGRASKKETPAGKRSSSSRAKPVKAKAATARKKSADGKTSSGARKIVKRVVSTVVGALTRRKKSDGAEGATAKTQRPARAARGTRREADIPMDQIAAAYTPTQTSLKAGFRISGEDRHRDQEFADGSGNGRWKDEDRLTNKSGDPRIGTHGRMNQVSKGENMEQERTNPAGFNTGSDFGSPTSSTSASGGMNNTGVTTCPHCGNAVGQDRGLEQFLGRIGISEEMINNLRSSMQNVDVEEYLNTARDYLKTAGDKLRTSGDKANTFAKENPGKVAAGVAVLAVGAGLPLSSLSKDR